MPTIRMTTRSSTRVKPSSRLARVRNVCSIDPPRTIVCCQLHVASGGGPAPSRFSRRSVALRPALTGVLPLAPGAGPVYRASIGRPGLRVESLGRMGAVCYQAPAMQPPELPLHSRIIAPAAVRRIEKVCELCLDCAVTVKVVRVASATPTVASAVGAPSTSGRPVVPSSAAGAHWEESSVLAWHAWTCETRLRALLLASASWALLCWPRNTGSAIAASSATIRKTTSISTSVKPSSRWVSLRKFMSEPGEDSGRARGPARCDQSVAQSAFYHWFPWASAALQPPSPALEHVRLIGGETVLLRVITNVWLAFLETAVMT